eukprot:1136283-Lingulodinium_polyedra.AAC.1
MASDDGMTDSSCASDGCPQGLMVLPVSFSGVKARDCKRCGKSSDSPNPFVDSHANDQFGGKRPWQRYVRSK